MAVRAINLDRRPRLAIEHAVAVNVLFEMAINAMHALFEVNVFKVDRLVETLRVVECDRLIFPVKPNTLAVVLEDRPVEPTVAVEISETGLFHAAGQVACV